MILVKDHCIIAINLSNSCRIQIHPSNTHTHKQFARSAIAICLLLLLLLFVQVDGRGRRLVLVDRLTESVAVR